MRRLDPLDGHAAELLASGERRSKGRRRLRLHVARLFGVDGLFLCEAAILDLSETGARLRLPAPERLPGRLVLFDEAARRIAGARLARVGEGEAGLVLLGWRDVDPATAMGRKLAAPYFALR